MRKQTIAEAMKTAKISFKKCDQLWSDDGSRTTYIRKMYKATAVVNSRELRMRNQEWDLGYIFQSVGAAKARAIARAMLKRDLNMRYTTQLREDEFRRRGVHFSLVDRLVERAEGGAGMSLLG